MKKLVFLLMALWFTVSIRAYDFSVNGIYYNITSSVTPFTVEVTYKLIPTITEPGYTGDITIPSSVNYNSIDYTVNAIGHDAFSLSETMSSVNLPGTIISIGTNAFRDCIGLNTILLPSSLKTIEGYAFETSNKLTAISIPQSVSNIGDYAFDNCSGLTSVNFPALSSVHSLGINAFGGCSSLISISLPDSLTSIGSSAFAGCLMLSTITIPHSVTSIGNYAFQLCKSLMSINIPASVTFIDSDAFYDCTGLNAIYAYPATPVSLNTNSNVFFDVNTATCVLHVPAGSKTAYQDSTLWKDFANIVEDLTTSVISMPIGKLKITVKQDCILLSGINAGDEISFYDLKGTIFYNHRAKAENVEVKLPIHQVYLVKVNNQKMKVIY
jgi:hypothetical protein